MDKAEVRKRFRRQPVPEDVSEAIIRNVRSCPLYSNAKLILTYMPLPDEPDLRALLSDEKTFAIPYIDSEDVMRFASYSGVTEEGVYGIAEPEEKSECLYPEGTIALIPALAFTADGYRIGRGKGYYDRFLSLHGDIYKIGIIPAERIVELEDIKAHDIPMDAIITEAGVTPVLRS